MYTVRKGQVVGILNDFDLAAIMYPGARFPPRSGWQRTGTIAFMAMDLLSNVDGQLPRWYRHDFESFSWCLMWKMMKDPPRKWLMDTIETVEDGKRSFIHNMDAHIEEFHQTWACFHSFMYAWLGKVRDYTGKLSACVTRNLAKENGISTLASRKIEIRNAEDKKKKDSSHIKPIVELAKKVACGESIPALENTSWIDVKVIASLR